MAWYEDLSVCDYFPLIAGERLRAVGWLVRGRAFKQGEVDQKVFERLCELTQDPWSPVACGGVHHCELCRFTGNAAGTFKGFHVSATASSVSLFVPGDGVIYVSPTSITHYIDAHGYQPPSVFCEAVLRCPQMRSMAYLKAMRASGWEGLRSGSDAAGSPGDPAAQ